VSERKKATVEIKKGTNPENGNKHKYKRKGKKMKNEFHTGIVLHARQQDQCQCLALPRDFANDVFGSQIVFTWTSV
jgi:hypothetical protein